MRIAVTGATGHLGANVVRDLLQHKHQVRALYHPDANRSALDGLAVESVAADVLVPQSILNAFRRVDAVIHLAAIISVNGDPDGLVMRTNVEGTRNVANACLKTGLKKLVHVSSIHAFKSTRFAAKIDESTPKADESSFVYDQSKAAGEREIHTAVEAGLNATILNPTGILGPHDYCSSLGGQMLRKLFTGKMPALMDAGFDWVDVRDVADAIRTSIAAGRTGEQYLLSGKWISFRELAALCEAASGTPGPRVMLPWWIARLGLPVLQMQSWLTGADPLYTYETLAILRDSNQNCSATKARRDLGFASRPLSETVLETFEWSRSHGFI